jgi:hypothetical protein
MTWIPGIPRDQAEGKLKELYEERTSSGTSRFAEVLMPMTYHPEILGSILMGGPGHLDPGFDRELAETIAVVVSSTNRCGW